MSEIFDKLIEDYKSKFNVITMYGIPISELNDDELRATICLLGDDMKRQRESFDKEREMYKLFRT